MEKSDFKEWVEGADKLCAKWQLALVLSNLFWACVLAMFIWFAYCAPVEMTQEQSLPTQSQSQVTKGAN